jgi:hypothetical protein
MSKPSPNKPRQVTLSPRDPVPGIQFIGFHGEVDAAHTPARRAALLADEDGWLVRLAASSDAPGEGSGNGRQVRVQIERGALQVKAEGPLPGVGTRLGPWPARLGYTVVLLGKTELSAAARLAAHAPADEAAATRFIHWLAQGRPEPVLELTAQLEGLVAWYCPEEEAHTLWLAILREARLATFHAFAGGPSQSLEEAAWWLSRAALSDDDLYLAAACLKHAGSPHAEAMLQAMLTTPPAPEELQKRMVEQLLFLDAEARLSSRPEETPSPGAISPHYPELTHARDRVRRLGIIQVQAQAL